MARELRFQYGDEEISVVGGQNGTSGLIEGSCLKQIPRMDTCYPFEVHTRSRLD
jgi:hypothetical protein